MIQWVKVSQFAKNEGYTSQYIGQLIKNGKIPAEAVHPTARPKKVNPELVKKYLQENTSAINKNEKRAAKKPAREKNETVSKTETPRQNQSQSPHENETLDTDNISIEELNKEPLGAVSIFQADTIKANYTALKVKAEYLEKMKLLLPADEVMEVWSKKIISAKQRIRSIKSKIAPILREDIDPTLFDSIMKLIDSLIAEVLEDLGQDEL